MKFMILDSFLLGSDLEMTMSEPIMQIQIGQIGLNEF